MLYFVGIYSPNSVYEFDFYLPYAFSAGPLVFYIANNITEVIYSFIVPNKQAISWEIKQIVCTGCLVIPLAVLQWHLIIKGFRLMHRADTGKS